MTSLSSVRSTTRNVSGCGPDRDPPCCAPPVRGAVGRAVNGLLVVVFWFSRFNGTMFSLHGALAFPVVLGSWMYSDVPATNVLGSDSRRVLEALDDEPMVMRLLAAKSALLWLMVAPGCLVIATISGSSTIDRSRRYSR